MKKSQNQVNKKYNLIISIISIVLVFGITMFLMYSYTKSTTSNVRQYAEFSVAQNSERISDEISSTIEYAMCSIREVSDIISRNIDTHENENPKDIINVAIKNTPFSAIEYINSDGINQTEAGEQFDASDRFYFVEGMKGNSGIWINYTPKYSDEALLDFYAPIYKNNQIIGVITGYLGGDNDILPILQSSFFGNEIRGILCDDNGIVITTTFNYPYGSKLEELAGTVGKTVNDRNEYISNLQSTPQRLAYYNDKYGQALAYTSRVKDTNWYVIQIVPGSSLKMVVGQLSKKGYMTVAGLLVIFIIIIIQILLDNKKKRQIEQQYINEVEKINDTLEKEKIAMNKIHETISSGSWLMEFNKDGSISSCEWSDGFRRLLGYYNKNDFPNSIDAIYNVLGVEINNNISEAFREAAMDTTDQKVFDFEYPVNTRTDGPKWFRAAGRFSRNEDGTPKVFHGLIIDINERKQSEEKLKVEQLLLGNSLKDQLILEENAEKQKIENEEIIKTYIKILKVNLSNDVYSIIQVNENEKDDLHGYSEKISEWLLEFANTDNVHPEDKNDYIQRTDIEYLKKYFKSGNNYFCIHYRRKYDDTYQRVLMEIVAATTYTDDNQEVFLYVKNIG